MSDFGRLGSSLYWQSGGGGFQPIVSTRCFACGELVDVSEVLATFGDTGSLGVWRAQGDSVNGYELHHEQCVVEWRAAPHPHPCMGTEGCDRIVDYDDQPLCEQHSSAGELRKPAYSYFRKHGVWAAALGPHDKRM